jgi:hypothetical protein
MRCGARTRFENITFSNLVMKNVTGPISIGLDSTSRRRPDDTRPLIKGVVRNIAFNGIRASVVAEGGQFADLPFPSEYRPGETRTCITLNGVGDDFLENISLTDVQVTYEGGGTAEEAAVRDVPKIAGEYFEVGTLPAYGLYARNVKGLMLHNVRFDVHRPDVRPAVVLDHVSDAALNGFSAQGNDNAESLLRLIDTRDVLLTACRVLTLTAVFIEAEGAACGEIVVDGGALSKAGRIVGVSRGASVDAIKVRA